MARKKYQFGRFNEEIVNALAERIAGDLRHVRNEVLPELIGLDKTNNDRDIGISGRWNKGIRFHEKEIDEGT